MTSDKPSTDNQDGKRLNGVNRRCKDFHRRYLALCRSKNFQPVAELINGATANRKRRADPQLIPALNFYGDRFKECDWLLITDALLEDTSLEMLAIRLRKVLFDTHDNGCYRNDLPTDRPIVLTKRLVTRLIDSLGQFLINNHVVRVFILEALPIQSVHVATLVNGLQHNHSITELSFVRSTIGDDGCASVCSAVMHLPKIESLNLSACQLTVKGCHAVAELIKYQKIQRFAQSWQFSLRYGDIETSKMKGLRNIMLNGNPSIGDEGLIELTEVLKDDEWIRQVHFRNCGLTDRGAKSLVDCLNINKTIEKFDIRANAGISNEACHEILIKLGVEMESSDSSQSLANAMIGELKMKPAEQIKFLKQQLTAERHTNTQLQLMVEQLHMQQTECAFQLSKLQQDYNKIIVERDALIACRQHDAKAHPKSRRASLRKSKSEALPKPSQLFGRIRRHAPNKQNVRGNIGSKSDICLDTTRHRQLKSVTPAHYPTRSHLLERNIGDSEITGQLNDIVELNEELEAVHKNFAEAGCGDTGIGCSNIQVRMIGQKFTQNNSGEAKGSVETSDEDYFVDIAEAADQWTSRNTRHELANGGGLTSEENDVDEDDLDETSANSLSGAELLKLFVKKRPAMKHANDTQSMFKSVYSGEGH
ncbi:protein Cep78 homolog isoform X2 [Wyeomyia smithii]|uniref:protein Cep78 homolog isoform X2 n=1 Tax=Wyeomyia smithii TaxID=174621 RepID=UPI0024681ED5|nr:protein Cep78 homolog isoform X2 [Wyeomyia smithii]